MLVGVGKAAPIPGLFPTGVNDANNLGPVGAVDVHYTVNGSNAILAAANPAWITAANASWLSVSGDGNANVSSAIPYDYATTFKLPANAVLDLAVLHVSLACDDTVEVYLNGHATGLPVAQENLHSQFSNFTVDGGSMPFYVPGTNILTFRVHNLPLAGVNPSGLIVASLSGEYTTYDVQLAISLYAGVSVSGPIGSTNRIEYVSSLGATNWQALTNLVLQQSPTLFFDLDSAKSSPRYYRATRIP